MKKIISITISLCLILCSFSFCFAAWGDSQISSVVSDVSSIKTTLSNIHTRITTIQGFLYDSNHSVAYWTSAIASWMSPIYQALTSNLAANLNLEPIIAGLNEVVSDGSNTTYYPYLKYNGTSVGQYAYNIHDILNRQLNSSRTVTMMRYQNGTLTFENRSLTFADALNTMHNYGVLPFANMVLGEFNQSNGNYNTLQTALNWTDIDSQYTFTPSSSTNGLYSWLAAIQAPVARLSYVLASDERIEAQEAAAANEEAVVDNFIDSNGDGSISTSNIGSVSDLSAGYKQNFGSDASPSGIFDIFNSDHASWFSQETKDQLDTTSTTRFTKGSASETPLLDKQIEDIYNALGVKQP